MLNITVPLEEAYDEVLEEFIVTKSFDLELEHSLVSLSKWESKFEKPFLSDAAKTDEETFWYILAMTQNDNLPPEVFTKLTSDHIREINEYVDSKQTATWFREAANPTAKKNKDIITAEVIYHMMIALNIPLEWETRHLSRLITLIRVCNEKNAAADGKKKPKQNSAQMAQERAALNEARRKRLGSNG